jgi:site-specific recombinase XerD
MSAPTPALAAPRPANNLAVLKYNLLPWPAVDRALLFADDLAQLRKDLDELDRQQRSAATRRAYRSDWKDFALFCAETGRAPLPALPQTVMLYLTYEARVGKAAGTITRRLAAITSEHKRAGLPTPCNKDVGLVLVDIRRKLGTAQKPKAPITLEALKLMLTKLDDDIRGLRDKAILLIGFASGCRRSELAAFDLADLTICLEGLILHMAGSKVDQLRKGRDVPVHRGEALDLFAGIDPPPPDTCPVRALEKWLVERGTWPGPLFCRVDLHTGKVTRQRLAPAAIAMAVKAAGKRAGMDPRQLGGHSMRRGCASAATANGADIKAIQIRLGHASIATTARYIDHANLFAVNPLKGVL